jgi:signal peptidase II
MTDDADAEVLSTSPTDAAEITAPQRQIFGVPVAMMVVVPAVLLVDQLTKRWAGLELTGRAPEHVIWTLQWNITRNSGMAFSQAQGIGPLIGIVAMLVVLWLAWTSRKLTSALTAVCAGLIAGGALGNLSDRLFRGGRLLHGSVVDFIDFQWFPIFNVADMAIDIGGALLVLWSLSAHRRARAE